MGYNRNNLRRIREKYETKHLIAEKKSDMLKAELYLELPELEKVDRQLSGLGVRLMGVALSLGDDKEKGLAELKAENGELLKRRAEILRGAGYPEDYTDVKYECLLCADSGYVGIKMCECMRNELILAGFESSGISELLRTQTFEGFRLDYYKANKDGLNMMTKIFDFAKRYAEEFDARTSSNLAMFGGTGLGKTHLSSAIARKVIEKGNDVYYTSAVSLVSDFEAEQFGGEHLKRGELTDKYFDCDLLIIDDLGAEMSNQFTLSCLYNLLNVRINRKTPVIISTNLTQNELLKKYNERIASRIFGEFKILPFTGSDVRMQKIKE